MSASLREGAGCKLHGAAIKLFYFRTAFARIQFLSALQRQENDFPDPASQASKIIYGASIEHMVKVFLVGHVSRV